MTKIIGISAFYHDSAASLIIDGKIVGAAQEERFTRKKHDARFPINSIGYLLKEANCSLDSIDHIIFYEKPFIKFERLLETYVANAPMGFKSFKKAMPVWLREKLFQKNLILKYLKKISKNFNSEKLLFAEHHESHAASAFYPSPYDEALILTIDGVGEWATTTISIGKDYDINHIKEIKFPHSLGLLYSAFTYYLGFKVNSGEYKVMGLAPYGNPKYKEIIKTKLINIKDDGSFFLNQDYFNYSTGLTMTNKKFANLFGKSVRHSETENLDQFHMDIAASIQEVIEEAVIKIVKNLSEKYKIKNLCMAGGVALNCVVNGKLLNSNYFDNIWVQPAAGDAGGSLGAALLYWHRELKNSKEIKKDTMQGSFLGPSFNNNKIEEALVGCGAKFERINYRAIIEKTANYLSNGKAVGWFQNRMEFGPRALGCRSILADPRSEKMQKNLNLKVKFRESFRPFAPSILCEHTNEWFDLDIDSPYMLFVSKIKSKLRYDLSKEEKELFGIEKLNIKRSKISAVTHIDYSARIQTVHKETNPMYHSLISKFYEITSCPILVNTSFNVRGEPIVCSPEDAFNCFMGTGLDALTIGNYFLDKYDQDENLKKSYKDKYELD